MQKATNWSRGRRGSGNRSREREQANEFIQSDIHTFTHSFLVSFPVYIVIIFENLFKEK